MGMDEIRPRLALTLGDPRGIGPEIAGKALQDARVIGDADYVIIGPTGTEIPVQQTIGAWPGAGGDAALAGRLAGAAIERAVELAMRGEVQGIVTAPIDKAALLAGGFDCCFHLVKDATPLEPHAKLCLR
jgi:4-hydroxythreonine-4-phosphate dehydrogenase